MKKMKRLTAVFLTASLMISLAGGCGRGNDTEVIHSPEVEEQGGVSPDNAEHTKGEDGQNAEGNTAMGRYVETDTDLSDLLERPVSMAKREDGALVILDAYRGKIVSRDNGMTWEQEKIAGIENMETFSEEHYILDFKLSPDGTLAILEYCSQDLGESSTILWLFAPDGGQQTVELPLTQEENYIRSIWFSPEGLLYAVTSGQQQIYEIQPKEGTSRKFLTVERAPDLIQFQGDYMIMENGEAGIVIYDKKTGSYVEDKVLKDFISEYYVQDYYASEIYTMFTFPGEENILYVAGEKGLHRHVIGGNAMELVIDGNLSSFGNPSVSIVSMLPLENNEFLALFNRGKLTRFTYDPNVPTMPASSLKVYSLTEQSEVRQAIAQFQTANPDVFVEYEVGMEGMDAATREDAVKNLNTRIMAGQGPDVLILDNLPIDSYVEKGMLLDLSSHVKGMTGDGKLLSNIVEGFTSDGKLYMLPMLFQVPVISGKREDIQKVSDLASLAQLTETLRKENEGKEIIGCFSPEAAVAWFLPVCAPALLEGGINEELLADYLTQVKRIYDSNGEGLPQQIKGLYDYRRELFRSVIYDASNYSRIGLSFMEYIGGDNVLMAGMLQGYSDYQENRSITRVKGREDTEIKLMKGYNSEMFYPLVMAGVSATSSDTEQALAFWDTLMSSQVQSLLYDGFPVNEEAWETVFYRDWNREVEPGDVVGSYGSLREDGTSYSGNIYSLYEEEIQQLREMLYSVRTPYLCDPTVKQVLVDAGASYLNGLDSLDAVIKQIKSRISLYMAE